MKMKKKNYQNIRKFFVPFHQPLKKDSHKMKNKKEKLAKETMYRSEKEKTEKGTKGTGRNTSVVNQNMFSFFNW